MLEKVGWFAMGYAAVSLTVTAVMLLVANRAFHLGGPLGMVRSIGLLILALIGLIVFVTKSLAGSQTEGVDDEIKKTVRKTSEWMDSLKKEWDNAKK